MMGYPIDEDIMRDHAMAILNYYAGDGWYRDGHSFDYYSCWAFNVYAPIWNLWYGYEKEPQIADAFEEHSNRLMETQQMMRHRRGRHARLQLLPGRHLRSCGRSAGCVYLCTDQRRKCDRNRDSE